MLSEITIKNIAVIESASVHFAEGFTVLTGETGAGKSILIDSINAILGNRTSRDVVRSGADKAGIWAAFAGLPAALRTQLAALGYDAEEDELLLQREISAEGKNHCRINGAPATAAVVRELCTDLVNIHGQHDNQSLLNPAKHVGILDLYAGNDALLAAYRAEYQQLAALRKKMADLEMDEGEKSRRMELLRFALEEIDGAQLRAGEEEDLLAQRAVAQNARQIVEAMGGAYRALFGDDEAEGAAVLLSRAAEELGDAGRFVPELAQYSGELNDMYYTVAEMASDINGRLAGYELGESSLDDIEQRLDLIYRLKQKYGRTVEEVLAYAANAREELENMASSAEKLAELATQEAKLAAQAQQCADRLTAARQEAFGRLNGAISGALAFLNMPGVALALRETVVPLGPQGQDEMEFLIATNPGEPLKPLAKIASGGELARIMLAIKSALADRDDTPTVIYDEIDTGISGLAAGRIGQMLRGTAAGRQVICVTHTAQIAAFATQHLLIEKQVRDGRTFTHIRELDEAERVTELARIISGDQVTETALANAREMLQLAREAAATKLDNVSAGGV